MPTAYPRNRRDTSTAGTLSGRLLGGKFELGARIGAGAMGEVYEARHLTSGMPVAIKVLRRHLLDNQDLVRRFRREARNAAVLKHPHSVLILESDQSDDDPEPYLVMELLRGRDLSRLLREEFPLSLPRVVRIASQILSAVAEAHAHQIVHRDLKPSNIMLVERDGDPDFVKVCDFGIAKMIDADGEPPAGDTSPLTAHGILCGTPEYMAPEQARAEPLDGRADLYSAAVILYQMVTGDVPFRAPSPMGVLSRQITEPPQAPSLRRPDLAIPPALERLILRGMAKNPADRPQTADAFRAELQRFVHASADAGWGPEAATLTSISPAPMPSTGSRPSISSSSSATAPNRRPVQMTIAVLGSLLLGVGAFAVNRRSAAPEGPPRMTAASSTDMGVHSPAPAPAPAQVLAKPAIAPAPGNRVLPPGSASTENEKGDRAVGAVSPPSSKIRSVRLGRAQLAPPSERSGRDLATRGSSVESVPAAPTIGSTTTPESSSPRALLAEGERLMLDGLLAEGCARLEEAKTLSPSIPSVYKLLGQCYMRLGRTTQAKANYLRYLELSPNASDTAFIQSMVN